MKIVVDRNTKPATLHSRLTLSAEANPALIDADTKETVYIKLTHVEISKVDATKVQFRLTDATDVLFLNTVDKCIVTKLLGREVQNTLIDNNVVAQYFETLPHDTFSVLVAEEFTKPLTVMTKIDALYLSCGGSRKLVYLCDDMRLLLNYTLVHMDMGH